VEHFDAGGKIPLRQLVKSKIFKVSTLPYIQAAIALPATYFLLTRLPIAGSVQATVYVVLVLIGVQISTFIGLYLLMHRTISIAVSWLSIAKYVLASLLTVGVLLLSPTTTTLLPTMAKAIAGFGIYLALLLAIDKEARALARLIWKEITGSIRQLKSKGDSGNELSNEISQ
jgi:hypothetical protein